MNSSRPFVRYAFLALLSLLSLIYFVTGLLKVIFFDTMMQNMAELHFGAVSTVVIGLIELSMVVLLWLPKYRTLALATLLLIMAGAMGAHWGHGHEVDHLLPVGIVAVVTFMVLWLDRGARLWQFVFRAH